MHYIWDVTLLDDSKIVNFGNKLKNDRFIIENKRTIWDNNELCKLTVQYNGLYLKYVKYQTEELRKLAIQLFQLNDYLGM